MVAAQEDLIRWALISTSSTARKRVLPAMSSLPRHELALVIGRSAEKTLSFKSEFEIGAAAVIGEDAKIGEYEDILRERDIDAVYISAPSALHAELVVYCLAAGKHVLCEKPMFRRVEELEKAAAAHDGQLVVENFSYAFTKSFERIVSLIGSGEIGCLLAIDVHFSFTAEQRHRIRYSRKSGGGSFLDLGCYAVDLVNRLCNDETSALDVHCRGPLGDGAEWLDSPAEPVDAECRFRLQSAAGVLATVSTSFESSPRQWLALHGTDGVIVARSLFRQEGTTPSVILLRNGRVRQFESEPVPQEELLLSWCEDKILGGQKSEGRTQWKHWKANASIIEHLSAVIQAMLDQS